MRSSKDVDILLDAAGDLAKISAIYDALLRQFGQTPQAVAWESDTGIQQRRFDLLLDIIPPGEKLDVADLGCGYGALFARLAAGGNIRSYIGYDIVESMVAAAQNVHRDPRATFMQSLAITSPCDVAMISGTFNMRLDVPAARWADYVGASLRHSFGQCRHGLAFNMTEDTEPERQDGIHYANRAEVLDFCRRELSESAEARQHPGLPHEFTILLRRD